MTAASYGASSRTRAQRPAEAAPKRPWLFTGKSAVV